MSVSQSSRHLATTAQQCTPLAEVACDKPGKEEVRQWLKSRRMQEGPPPSPDEIRKALSAPQPA